MGWWIYLEDEDGIVNVDAHMEGGVIALGGNNQADMSVTWNYSQYYYEHIDKENGFRWLNDKVAMDTIERLKTAINLLGTETSNDYWESTPGNAGNILKVLLGWARQHPKATWRVS